MFRPSRPPLSDVEAALSEYRTTRDRELRNRIVETYLPVAERCARRYVNRGEPLDDLMQVARVALVRAVERFDPDRGAPFETFAVPTVLGELRHHFRDSCWAISVPRRAKDHRHQVFRAMDALGQQLGRQPTADEIAEALDLEPDVVSATIEANRHFRATAWDPTDADGAYAGKAHASADDPGADAASRVDTISTLRCLDERLRQVVIWRFYEECTQREIGARLGVGQVQVSRLLATALRQLRAHECPDRLAS